MSQVTGTMQDISQSSKKIADIIGVIDGIAFQTNILALNAAVEAAKEIKNLIGANVERVEAGTKQVDEAGASMQEIVTQAERVRQMIGELSNAAVEQSQGIGQVGTAGQQLDQVTQQNAALVEETASGVDADRKLSHF